jgi:hypothetical protein
VPVMVLYAVEGEGVRDLGWGHRILEILLVCKHEDHCVLEVTVLEQPEKLVFDDVDASTVGAVDYYNHSMSSSVVCCPRTAETFLSSQIPHLQHLGTMSVNNGLVLLNNSTGNDKGVSSFQVQFEGSSSQILVQATHWYC